MAKVTRQPQNSPFIVLKAVAICLATALLGGSIALVGYRSTKSHLELYYKIEGKGVLDDGCDSKFDASCFKGPVGLILEDRHATVLSRTFAKRFDSLGICLVSVARGSCSPLFLVEPRDRATRSGVCNRLIAPFERLLARADPVTFAIITANWGDGDETAKPLSDLISKFDPRTRILLIGPVPIFAEFGLECVTMSDRYGTSCDRCAMPRSEVDASNAAVVKILKTMPDKFPNVRYIDVTELFCDKAVCRPFKNNEVFYLDTHHVSPEGADRIYDSFESDFKWLAGKE